MAGNGLRLIVFDHGGRNKMGFKTPIPFPLQDDESLALEEVLNGIGKKYSQEINTSSSTLVAVNLMKEFLYAGKFQQGGKYNKTEIYYPTLSYSPNDGSMADGGRIVDAKKLLEDYVMLDSGILVPGYLANKTKISRKTYYPLQNMLLLYRK